MSPKNVITVMLLTLAATQLTGCSFSPFQNAWPTPPEDIVRHGPPTLEPDPNTMNRMSIATNYALEMLKRINTHYLDRTKVDWANGDFISTGAIAAVGGALSGQPGLMNSGAGMSVLGLSASQRYQYTAQREAYAITRSAMQCVLARAKETSDREIQWGMTTTTAPNLNEIAQAIPTTVVDATIKVQESLIHRLISIENKPLDAGEIRTAAQAQVAAANKAKDEGEKLQADMKDPVALAVINAKTAENSLIPTNRQIEVTKRIIGLEPAIKACIAGL